MAKTKMTKDICPNCDDIENPNIGECGYCDEHCECEEE
jgi:hypothetical protein